MGPALGRKDQTTKALLTTNQLPQPNVFPLFKDKGGPEFSSALKNSHKALKALLRSLVDLQEELLFQYPDTRYLVDGTKPNAGSEEISSEDDELVEEKTQQRRRVPCKEEAGDGGLSQLHGKALC